MVYLLLFSVVVVVVSHLRSGVSRCPLSLSSSPSSMLASLSVATAQQRLAVVKRWRPQGGTIKLGLISRFRCFPPPTPRAPNNIASLTYYIDGGRAFLLVLSHYYIHIYPSASIPVSFERHLKIGAYVCGSLSLFSLFRF